MSDLTVKPGQSSFPTRSVSFGGLHRGGSLGGGKKIGGTDNFHAKEMSEVSDIGAQKRAGYENGVGGTNQATETTGNLLMLIA